MTEQDQLAVYDQIIDTFTFINRLLAGDPARPDFQKYARGILRPAFDRVGWEAKPSESSSSDHFSAPPSSAASACSTTPISSPDAASVSRNSSPIRRLISPDLRPTIFTVVGRYADSRTWEKLHELGLKTTSTEEKQNYYAALASAIDPKLVPRTIALALTEELPDQPGDRVAPLCGALRRASGPRLGICQAHMKALLAKQDALGINSFAAGLFNFYSDAKEAETLEAYAKSEPAEIGRQSGGKSGG